MKNLFLSLILPSIFYLLLSASADAAVTCQPIYGGGQSCVQTGNLIINKTVSRANPNTRQPTNEFVDNININDTKYGPDSFVNFQVTITNSGNAVINQINVQDIFPQFINFQSGPGSFSGKTLTFQVFNLQPNESRTFGISAKAVSAAQLPDGVVCPVNQAIATDVATNQSSQDNAQFCIQRVVAPTQLPGQAVTQGVLSQEVPAAGVPAVTKGGAKVFPPPKVVTTPPTGPEALSLFALIPGALSGFYLRRKSGR